QIKDLEKAKQELANLEDSRAKIIKLIEEQQRVQLTTARTAAEGGKKAEEKAPAKKNFMAAEEAGQKAIVASDPKKLSGEQDRIAKDTEKVKGDLQAAEKDAAQPLADAKGNMVDAKGKLDALDLNNATPAQLEAIANLFKAKDVLDKRIDELKKQLGQEENDFGKLADAAAKIAEL